MMMTTDEVLESPRTSTGTIRVFLVEDHRIVLWGLQRMVESAWPRLSLAGTARSLEELMNADGLESADLVLLDLDLSGQSSLDALPALRRRNPSARVLVLTGCEDTSAWREAVVRGARGVLHKSAPPDVLMRAIEKVAAGELWLRSDLLSDVFGQLTGEGHGASSSASPEERRIASLTQRERDVVSAMVRHAGDKQFAVAQSLDMSEHTLRNHLTTIYGKLGVRGRLELHLFATSHGLSAAA